MKDNLLEEPRMKFAIVLYFIGLIGLILWVVGKLFGWIHSPIWVQMLPYTMGILSLLAVVLSAGMALEKLTSIGKDVKEIKGRLTSVEKQVTINTTLLGSVEKRVTKNEESISHLLRA